MNREELVPLAEALLKALHLVGAAARSKLSERRGLDVSSALVEGSRNIAGVAKGMDQITLITQGQEEQLRHLCREPYVCRVIVADEDGKEQTYYFARAAPLSGVDGLDGKLGIYRHALGRIAELAPGQNWEGRIRGETVTLTVKERVRLRPTFAHDEWDGCDDRIELGDANLTIESLLALVRGVGDAAKARDADVFGALLADARAASAVLEGFQRKVVDRMALRDQPILNPLQGEVFRLPLDRRLFLHGPPGTGKTTTLIHRLAQKRSFSDLDEDERALIPAEHLPRFFHGENWVMFTPTELLKLYLKEAFACEGVPASEQRVRTWDDERRRLAQDTLAIIRADRGGRFQLRESSKTLRDGVEAAPAALADAFDAYFREYTVGRYRQDLAELDKHPAPEVVRLSREMRARAGGDSLSFDLLLELGPVPGVADARLLFDERAKELFKKHFNAVAGRDAGFLDTVADVLDGLSSERVSEDDDSEDEDDEDRPAQPTRDRRISAAEAYRRAVYVAARATYTRGAPPRTGRTPRILQASASAAPTEGLLRELGEALITLRRLRYLESGSRNLVDRVPQAYQRFRRANAKATASLFDSAASDAIDRGFVSGTEVDVMLLTMLRNARQVLSRGTGRLLYEDTRIATLESVKGEYVTQILVDEATDFSSVQLACMLELAHPRFRSFFLCGDFRQRVTTFGIRSKGDLSWIASDFDTREINIAYRQTGRLATLAQAIAGLDGSEPPRMEPPPNVQDLDVSPVLGEGLRDGALAKWLSSRIGEVLRILGKVPSIAIFVDGEDRLDPLVAALVPLLEQRNLRVVACREGRIIGGERDVRVFDVRHIKGLEFEAVFFAGIDDMQARVGELFSQYLFVGVTRAATYLGVTC